MPVPAERRRAHFIGIAGTGMRSLADLLRQRGWRVGGTDLHAPQGVPGVFGRHDPRHVAPDVDLVVASDAIPVDHCERRRAAELGIPIRSYAEMLGRLTRAGHGLAVAGTHGKSTATAMAADVLLAAGLDPTVVVGAVPCDRASGGRSGSGPHVLVEACEYRSNFLKLDCRAAAILNVEPDHFDTFPDDAALDAGFGRFAARLPADGLLVAAHDCRRSRRAARQAGCRVETFSVRSPDATWRATGLRAVRGRYRFELRRDGRTLRSVALGVPGLHNVHNALAAAALATSAGADASAVVTGLTRFAGLRRRLERAGRLGAATWIDDYAHHPTAVKAALAAVRAEIPRGRIWCLFQPHQQGRLTRLLPQFAAALRGADRLLVAEVYRAREGVGECAASGSTPPGSPPVGAAELAEATRRLGIEVEGMHGAEPLVARLVAAARRGELTAGDRIITMGAGDVDRIARRAIGRLGEVCRAPRVPVESNLSLAGTAATRPMTS